MGLIIVTAPPDITCLWIEQYTTTNETVLGKKKKKSKYKSDEASRCDDPQTGIPEVKRAHYRRLLGYILQNPAGNSTGQMAHFHQQLDFRELKSGKLWMKKSSKKHLLLKMWVMTKRNRFL